MPDDNAERCVKCGRTIVLCPVCRAFVCGCAQSCLVVCESEEER